jgi:hypothetical protein
MLETVLSLGLGLRSFDFLEVGRQWGSRNRRHHSPEARLQPVVHAEARNLIGGRLRKSVALSLAVGKLSLAKTTSKRKTSLGLDVGGCLEDGFRLIRNCSMTEERNENAEKRSVRYRQAYLAPRLF